MKVALVHDWLTTCGGAERVLEQIIRVLPEADLFSLIDFLPETERGFLGGRPVRTSFLRRLPWARRRYRQYLPLMPFAIEQLDFSGYDLVVSSSYAVAKGALTGPDQLHLCFCHSPMRYAWDLQNQYLKDSGLDRGLRSVLARWLLHGMRNWDVRSSTGVDDYIAVSRFVARRIRKAYRRDATVIYPPVDTETFAFSEARREPFYFTASRLVSYKRVDLMIEAFAGLPDRQLVVMGDGPEAARLRTRLPPNVRLIGPQPLSVLLDHLQRARAFVFAAIEDFGIAPVEAQACGTPVVALGQGAAPETIRGLDSPQPTGVFFPQQTSQALRSAIMLFERESSRIAPEACRANALRFSVERFRLELDQFIRERYAHFRQELAAVAD